MCAKDSVLVYVIRVSWLPTNMIFGNEKLVEAIVGFYYWVIVLENFEFFVFDFNI